MMTKVSVCTSGAGIRLYSCCNTPSIGEESSSGTSAGSLSSRDARPVPADGTGDREFDRSLDPRPDGVTERVREAGPCDDRGVCCPEASGEGAALVLLLFAEALTSSSVATCLAHMEASSTKGCAESLTGGLLNDGVVGAGALPKLAASKC